MSGAPWFQRTTIYQIYPRSYYDTIGDGIGDIQGLIQKLDYIRDLGFETVWCSPFFASPQRDFGYDISDYRDIAAEYGTLAGVRACRWSVSSLRSQNSQTTTLIPAWCLASPLATSRRNSG